MTEARDDPIDHGECERALPKERWDDMCDDCYDELVAFLAGRRTAPREPIDPPTIVIYPAVDGFIY